MRWTEFMEPTPAERKRLSGTVEAAERGELPDPGWEEVRIRRERRVWRLPGEPVLYLKLQLYLSFKVRFRYALRSSPTLTEARHCLHLARAGLAGPEPLLHGHLGLGPWRRRTLLVTRALAGEPAAAALAGGRLALAELADLVARLRQAGVHHRDLHLDNILAHSAGLRLLDLQSVRFLRPPLGAGEVLAMAVKLGDSLLRRGAVKEPRPWLQALARQLPRPPDAAAFHRLLARQQRRELRRRLSRCLAESSGFTRERSDAGRVHRRREVPAAEVGAAAAAAWTAGEGLVPAGGEHWCLVGPAGAVRRAWLGLRRLELAGECARPPLALVLRGAPWRRRGCLVLPAGLGRKEAAALLERAGK